jgi:hypothetical protein
MKAIKTLAVIFSCVFFTSQSLSAEIWPKSPASNYHNSVVRLGSSSGVGGSGSVIKFIKDSEEYPEYYVGLILTASHVIKSSNDLFVVKFNNGDSTIKNTVAVKMPIGSDRYNDVGLIRALIPDEISPLEFSSELPKAGSTVNLFGYGTGELRGWSAVYAGSPMGNDGIIVFSWAIQGDSGGPIIYNGKVIGVICWGTGVGKFKNTRRLIICPINGSNVGRVKNFIKAFSA